MKRTIAIIAAALLAALAFSACAGAEPDTQTPDLLGDIGKTLAELKGAQSDGEVIVRTGGFPDAAAVCFGLQEAEALPCFLALQSGDAEGAMREYEEQLKCAGLVTTAGVLFPGMEDEPSFDAFFASIGVDEYEYLVGDEVIGGEGWLRFAYRDMAVLVNTNEMNAAGGWTFTGEERVRRDAPAIIVDTELLAENYALTEAVLFGDATP